MIAGRYNHGMETTAGTVVSGSVTGIEHFKAADKTPLWYTGRSGDVSVTGGSVDDFFSSGSG
jgi:hypothetical protein